MKYILTIITIICLTGCASNEVKAPCDYQGSFCGTKLKINH